MTVSKPKSSLQPMQSVTGIPQKVYLNTAAYFLFWINGFGWIEVDGRDANYNLEFTAIMTAYANKSPVQVTIQGVGVQGDPLAVEIYLV